MAGNAYPAAFEDAAGTVARLEGEVQFTDGTNQPSANVNPQTSGALATTTFSSTTAAQVSTTRTVTTYTAYTWDNSSADATLKVELSPDNSTFSTLATITNKTFTNAVSGNIGLLTVVVPAGWYMKLTSTHVTIGTTTYA